MADSPGSDNAPQPPSSGGSRLPEPAAVDAVSAVHLVRRMSHDFNNLFSVILGGLGLLREEIPAQVLRADVNETFRDVESAAREAAGVIASLTAWAARQALDANAMDLNAVVSEIAPMLERGLPKNVSFVLELNEDPVLARVDRDRLHGAIVELCANAREAMPNGGTLRMGTSNGASPRVHVRDTGEGMDASVLAICRQPYVTFRDASTHRGLGLSVVDGFMRASGGKLTIESISGGGTLAVLHFPSPTPEGVTTLGD